MTKMVSSIRFARRQITRGAGLGKDRDGGEKAVPSGVGRKNAVRYVAPPGTILDAPRVRSCAQRRLQCHPETRSNGVIRSEIADVLGGVQRADGALISISPSGIFLQLHQFFRTAPSRVQCAMSALDTISGIIVIVSVGVPCALHVRLCSKCIDALIRKSASADPNRLIFHFGLLPLVAALVWVTTQLHIDRRKFRRKSYTMQGLYLPCFQ